MNTASLVGRLTRDIELRYTQAGKAVGSFTLAVNRSFTNQQGEREADFINCVIWGKGAETLANYTRKGYQLGVVGSIMTRNYENQQGQKVYVTEINVRDFDLLEPKKDGQQAQGGVNQAYSQQQPQQQYQQQAYNQMQYEGHPIDVNPDDLPF